MICRLCLMNLNSEKSVALFDIYGINADAQLLKIIDKYLHLDITWNDEISNVICQNCWKCLIEFDKYCAYIREQQIMLSQRVPVVDDHTDAEIVPVQVNVKNEPVVDVAIEKSLKCEAKKDVAEEDLLTMEAQLKCEPEEANFTEITVMSSTISNDSACRDWRFNQNLERRSIEDSSTSYYCMTDKQVQFIPDPISIKLLQPIQEIYKCFLLGNALEDNDRTIIAEAVIKECLKNKSEKVLKCTDFAKLADNIIEVFPSDHVSTYYLWPTSRRPASGKLFFAYNKQLISSVKTKIKTKYNTKKIAMTSTERSRKYRAKKYKVDHKESSNIRIYSAVIDETLAVENFVVQNTAEDDIVARETHPKCLSEDDVLTRTTTKMKTKKKPMTSAERTRKHRARKDQVNYMNDFNIDSAADINEYLEAAENIDTQSVETVTNNMDEDGTMQMPQKYLSEEDVRPKTITKTKTKTKPMTATERSRIYRARKYHIHNLENMKISSSASIDGTLGKKSGASGLVLNEVLFKEDSLRPLCGASDVKVWCKRPGTKRTVIQRKFLKIIENFH